MKDDLLVRRLMLDRLLCCAQQSRGRNPSSVCENSLDLTEERCSTMLVCDVSFTFGELCDCPSEADDGRSDD